MVTTESDTGSFRDPSGQVFIRGGKVFRTVTNVATADFDFVRSTSLIDGLIQDELLVAEHKVDPSVLDEVGDSVCYVLEHPPLPFVSYPYEWCFQALKAAALLHLDVHLRALHHDVSLSDATAYNVQFLDSSPIFIDHLSFKRYREGEYWAGHGQFCEQFLNPLLLRAHCGLPHNAWYRGGQEGISVEDLSKILPWNRKYLSWNTLTHVVLQARLQRAELGREKASAATKRSLPKTALISMLSSLRGWISRLEPAGSGKTVWRDYSKEHSYTDSEVKAKRAFVEAFVSAVKPAMLWDLGCNTGDYSKLALQTGAGRVVGFDFDQGALDLGYLRARREGLKFFPLFLDAANPAPNQGWAQTERRGFNERSNAGAIIALALVHHIAIGRNIPLDSVLDWLMALAPTGVIEFVPKSDAMVQELLRLREDIFPDYHVDHFLNAVRSRARVVREQVVSESGRLLVWYETGESNSRLA